MMDQPMTNDHAPTAPLKPMLDWIDANVKVLGFTTPEQEIAHMSTVIESQKRVHRITPEAQARFHSDRSGHQQQLISLADSLVLTVQYLGFDVANTWQGWRYDAGHALLAQDTDALKAHGLELLLTDLLGEPDLLEACVTQLRDALHQTNNGPFLNSLE